MPYTYFFFFNDTATTEIYTLSLHDALPISRWYRGFAATPPGVPLISSSRGTHVTSARESDHHGVPEALRHRGTGEPEPARGRTARARLLGVGPDVRGVDRRPSRFA